MPQLPSGRHVGLSHDAMLKMADNYRIDLLMDIIASDKEHNGILKFINVTYYDATNELPNSDKPTLGNPYLSDLLGSDVATDKCDWTEEDKAAFFEWVNSDRMQQGFRSVRNEFNERLKKAKVPEALHGIMDGD